MLRYRAAHLTMWLSGLLLTQSLFAMEIHILEEDQCLDEEKIRDALAPICLEYGLDTDDVEIVFKRLSQTAVRARYQLLLDNRGVESVRTFAINHSECSDAPALIAFYIEDDLQPAPHHPIKAWKRKSNKADWSPFLFATAGYAPFPPDIARGVYGGGVGIDRSAGRFILGTSLRFRQASPYLLEKTISENAQVLLKEAQLLLSPGLQMGRVITTMHIGGGRAFWQPSGLNVNDSGSATAIYMGLGCEIDIGESFGLVFEWIANLRRPRFQFDTETQLLTSHFSHLQLGLKYSF